MPQDLQLLAVIANAKRAMSTSLSAHTAQRQACWGVQPIERSNKKCVQNRLHHLHLDSMVIELGCQYSDVITAAHRPSVNRHMSFAQVAQVVGRVCVARLKLETKHRLQNSS